MKERIHNREVKVCPVVLRNSGNSSELLLFEHPLADVQLVKGTLELTDVSIESAGLRNLKKNLVYPRFQAPNISVVGKAAFKINYGTLCFAKLSKIYRIVGVFILKMTVGMSSAFSGIK